MYIPNRKDIVSMCNNKKIALLGGDLRQHTAAVILAEKGWDVSVWGLTDRSSDTETIKYCRTLEDAIENAYGVVFPLPSSVDGFYLNAPFEDNEKYRLSDIVALLDGGAIVIGGKIPLETVIRCEERGIKAIDYFLSEDFQIQNAYITAEAAISIAMNSLDKNLSDSRVAITGYGRISRHLVRLLKALGADVTVVARKTSDLAWGYSSGCSVIRIGEEERYRKNIYELTKGYDVIYNTVPHWLFDRSFLKSVDKSTFIIDLASAPGGVDISAAKELGSNVRWAASLPGKYAPVSAGRLIGSCVDSILRGEGEDI